MNQVIDDKKLIIGFIGATVISWNIILKLRQFFENRKRKSEWVPVGRIKSLHIYPIKSCKAKNLFQYRCTPFGPVDGEYFDRYFLVINGQNGKFYTARTKPKMVLISTEIQNGLVKLSYPTIESVNFDLADVLARKDVRTGFLHDQLRTDGFDCGDEVSVFLSEILEEPDTRLIFFHRDLINERVCKTENTWWKNNPVPQRIDVTAYADLAPYMITTQGSLNDLNSRLENEKNKVSSDHFRPCIVVDDCPAWDEDKWLDLRIGDVELQCFKPCTRCVLTTVDPKTGEKNDEMQPLRKLREFRLAPDGSMRQNFKNSPIFGVNAGLVKPGFIHQGQVVWARYKPTEF